MTHPDADTLLKHVLETLDEPERSEVAGHLAGCEACRKAETEIRGDIRKLEAIGSDVEVPPPPALPRMLERTRVISQWAAVLAAGFLLGYITSNLTSTLPATPVQQRLVPERIVEDTLGFLPCPPVDAAAPASR